jgi:hypothetical protein
MMHDLPIKELDGGLAEVVVLQTEVLPGGEDVEIGAFGMNFHGWVQLYTVSFVLHGKLLLDNDEEKEFGSINQTGFYDHQPTSYIDWKVKLQAADAPTPIARTEAEEDAGIERRNYILYRVPRNNSNSDYYIGDFHSTSHPDYAFQVGLSWLYQPTFGRTFGIWVAANFDDGEQYMLRARRFGNTSSNPPADPPYQEVLDVTSWASTAFIKFHDVNEDGSIAMVSGRTPHINRTVSFAGSSWSSSTTIDAYNVKEIALTWDAETGVSAEMNSVTLPTIEITDDHDFETTSEMTSKAFEWQLTSATPCGGGQNVRVYTGHLINAANYPAAISSSYSVTDAPMPESYICYLKLGGLSVVTQDITISYSFTRNIVYRGGTGTRTVNECAGTDVLTGYVPMSWKESITIECSLTHTIKVNGVVKHTYTRETTGTTSKDVDMSSLVVTYTTGMRTDEDCSGWTTWSKSFNETGFSYFTTAHEGNIPGATRVDVDETGLSITASTFFGLAGVGDYIKGVFTVGVGDGWHGQPRPFVSNGLVWVQDYSTVGMTGAIPGTAWTWDNNIGVLRHVGYIWPYGYHAFETEQCFDVFYPGNASHRVFVAQKRLAFDIRDGTVNSETLGGTNIATII